LVQRREKLTRNDGKEKKRPLIGEPLMKEFIFT